MKNILVTLFLLANIAAFGHGGGGFKHSDIFKNLGPNDKVALLMVHFGTTHDDTRILTIETINKKAAQTFPGIEVREAYTSRMIMRRLKEKGITKLNPTEAMDKLIADGYTHLIIQPTNIIEGIEMEALRKEVDLYRAKFKDIRLGNALLYTPDDYQSTVKAIAASLKEAKGNCIFVCHGTYHPANSTYGMLDYVMKARGHKNYHVGTIEGYPAFDDIIRELEAAKAKEVTLVPFMFVAGDHAKNDIAGEWKEELEKRGYKVNVYLKGLGENPAIQDLFIQHAKFASTHQREDIIVKKKKYEKTDDID